MKIYTSYFGNIKNIPPHIWPLSIARQRPAWYGGSELDIVAPSSTLLHKYHSGEINWDEFSTLYRAELDSLDPAEVLQIIDDLVWSNDVCLLCYEKPEEHCHRHILASWLTDNVGQHIEGERVEEYIKIGGGLI